MPLKLWIIMGLIATTIIAVDIDPVKLEWAKGFGATHTVNPMDGDAVEPVFTRRIGVGPGVVIHRAGSNNVHFAQLQEMLG